MPATAQPDPDHAPSPAALDEWVAAAQTGSGTPWLPRAHAVIFAAHALKRGFGISLMEAASPLFTEPPRDSDWEILGADTPGDNWVDHHDPHQAFALFERKIRKATRDKAQLRYKFWLAQAGQPGSAS